MKLFIDDLRPCPEGWECARTYDTALLNIMSGKVTEISFDHDLGEPEPRNGARLARHIEELAYYGEIQPIKWTIHSANPVGRSNIEAAMMRADLYWDIWLNTPEGYC